MGYVSHKAAMGFHNSPFLFKTVVLLFIKGKENFFKISFFNFLCLNRRNKKMKKRKEIFFRFS